MAKSTPLQPYLLIAYYEWMVDNGWTPQVLVDCSYPEVDVPQQFANDGKIVLNIAPEAVANFELNHNYLSFSARFSGKSLNIYIPMNAIVAIYARENDQGIMFSPNMYSDEPAEEPQQTTDHDDGDGPDDEPPKPPKGRPNLKVVK
ncbi:ClpXP protease specificity-enhancing factor [Kangiella sediminilitoris]|uniref:Stringent starvation protein B n=1 Tax=Kangiella sediminilitoris TaxID=1144748 RepID=A0A1B3BCE4_9GAMM|nr:ClpXP protease specificity-enhancing factor [Kangiella sediminilitoris]AOE50484.1 Stringent starvation protein B [Kangiella sediminilitoris]